MNLEAKPKVKDNVLGHHNGGGDAHFNTAKTLEPIK